MRIRPLKMSWCAFCDTASVPTRGSRLLGPLTTPTTMTPAARTGALRHAPVADSERTRHTTLALFIWMSCRLPVSGCGADLQVCCRAGVNDLHYTCSHT